MQVPNSTNSDSDIVYGPNLERCPVLRDVAKVVVSTAACAVIAGVFASYAEMYCYNTKQVNIITAIYAAPAIIIGGLLGGLVTGIYLATHNNKKVLHQT
jgi:uncharacterized membrane protein YfcA